MLPGGFQPFPLGLSTLSGTFVSISFCSRMSQALGEGKTLSLEGRIKPKKNRESPLKSHDFSGLLIRQAGKEPRRQSVPGMQVIAKNRKRKAVAEAVVHFSLRQGIP